jgi:hypothetical protein
MQLRRTVVALLVAGSLLPAVPASAAKAKPKPKPKPPVCFLIKDDEGDGTAGPFKTDTLDVLSADISTGPKEITAILRLKSGAIETDNYLKLGGIWNFNITAGGTNYSFYAQWPSAVRTTPQKLVGGLTVGNNDSTPAAVFRKDGNNFVWTVSRAAMAPLRKPNQSITVTSATSGAASFGGDSAFAKPNTKYLDKYPSCLRSK